MIDLNWSRIPKIPPGIEAWTISAQSEVYGLVASFFSFEVKQKPSKEPENRAVLGVIWIYWSKLNRLMTTQV